MQQHEREMLVGAFLSVTLGEWMETVEAYQKGYIEIPDDLHDPIVQFVSGLQDKAAYQVYLQQLALTGDARLLQLVILVTGQNPLEP